MAWLWLWLGLIIGPDCTAALNTSCHAALWVRGAAITREVVDWANPAPAGFIPPHGAGEVIPAPIPAACSVTPSTGQMSGVNIRGLPDVDAPIIGDIAINSYRPVSAISDDWLQTVTRDGRAGFVATSFTTVVGACGDVPRFVVTSP